MNPKLIIASLAGVGVLGGGATGCYYYCGQKTSEKQKSTTSTEKTTLDTSKSQETGPQKQNRQSAPSSVPEGSSKVSARPEQPLQNQEATKSSVGTQDVGRTSETSSVSALLGAD